MKSVVQNGRGAFKRRRIVTEPTRPFSLLDAALSDRAFPLMPPFHSQGPFLPLQPFGHLAGQRGSKEAFLTN